METVGAAVAGMASATVMEGVSLPAVKAMVEAMDTPEDGVEATVTA